MKKVIALLLAAIMMVSVVAIALAGGDPATCPHSSCHWVVKVKANCMHGGTEWWTCNACGKALYYRNTAKTSHAWAHRTTKYPTFKEMGKVHYYCTTPGCTAQYNSDLPRRDPATATQNEKTAARIVYGDNDLKSGKSGGYVLQLKDALIKEGLYDANLDKKKDKKDVYDADVVNAVKKFQKKYGLTQDGVAGIKTKVVLNDN